MAKTDIKEGQRYNSSADSFLEEPRLNVNDLLKRRKMQKKIDRKNNLIVVSGVTAAAAALIGILSL